MPEIPITTQANLQQPTQPIIPHEENINKSSLSLIDRIVNSNIIKISSILLIIITIISLLVYFKIIRIDGLQNQNNTQQPKEPNVAPTAQFNILYKDPADKVGRTIFYKDRIFINDGKRLASEGIGWTSIPKNNPRKAKDGINAIFKGWEDIPGTTSKYMKLQIPKESEIIPIRVVFDKSKDKFFAEFIEELNATRAAKMTNFDVENLDTIVRKGPEEGLTTIYAFADLPKVDQDRLLKDGDAVTVVFYFDINNGTRLSDEKFNFVAQTVTLRRFGGIDQIAKESYRPIW